jgi:isopenicillin N synthase-like dioxygenase
MDFLTEHMPYMPGKVPLDNKERYAFAYFYEPDFRLDPGESPNIGDYKILYSTQCIHMYMRNFHEHNDAGSSISVEA